MTQHARPALKELQTLDRKIREVLDRVESYEPQILEVEEPALELERQVQRTEGRIQEMRLEERRLELSLKEKKTRQEKLKERLTQVRNVREESAVNTELEMVARSLENEETEGFSLLEQIRRLELELEEQTDAWEHAKAEVEPRREALIADRDKDEADVKRMQAEREALASSVDDSELKVYDAIRSGGRRVALAALTQDGACENCFTMVPLQIQTQIRTTDAMIRCEGCGVILTPLTEEEVAAQEAAEAAATEAGDNVLVVPEANAGLEPEEEEEVVEEEISADADDEAEKEATEA